MVQMRNAYKNLVGKSKEKGPPTGVDRRIILKWILRKQSREV
jgi:hypothetical protein